MKLTLAENWRELHKRGTVILAAIFAAITGFGPTLLDAWNSIPPDLKAALPEGTARYVSSAAFLLMIVVRYTSVRRAPKEVSDGTN